MKKKIQQKLIKAYVILAHMNMRDMRIKEKLSQQLYISNQEVLNT